MILNLGGGAAAPKLTSIKVTTQPTKTSYKVGESFSKTGMVVTAYFDDGTSSVVTGYTYSPTTVPLGKSNITLSYTHEGITQTTTVAVSAIMWLYDTGTVYTENGGGFNMSYGSLQSDHIKIRTTSEHTAYVCTKNKINLDGATTLHVVTYAAWGHGEANTMGMTTSVSNIASSEPTWNAYANCATNYQTYTTSTLSLTSLSGSYYFAVYGDPTVHNWQIRQIWIS